MPVRGDLNEPDFRYGRVVLNALVNLITKVATSPFSALGGLVGGSGEDLQFIEFMAGSESLEVMEQRKIESIAKASRNGRRYEWMWRVADPARDREALALQKIDRSAATIYSGGNQKSASCALALAGV
ncbi:MAG: hypothetical protein IPO99_18480 [Nitrospira sp.]|nr:hypothetical protein [Nitrospira sp.]